MATTTVFLPGKFPRQRSLVGYSPGGHKELDTTKHVMDGDIINFKVILRSFSLRCY